MMLLFSLAAVGALLAQDGQKATDAGKTASENVALYIASAFGMAMVSSFGAIAMSISVKSFCEGVSRNPGTADRLQFGLILTLVLIETLALYVLAVLFVKVV